QHGEVRRVRGVDTVVAEDSTNFKNLVDAANYGTLQIQLSSNAKRHRLIKCVQVCLEWTGLSATVDELQDRGFNLDVALIFQCTANRAHDAGALVNHFGGFLAHDQVCVALTDASLVCKISVQYRQRRQSLRRHGPGLVKYRQLPRLRSAHF